MSKTTHDKTMATKVASHADDVLNYGSWMGSAAEQTAGNLSAQRAERNAEQVGGAPDRAPRTTQRLDASRVADARPRARAQNPKQADATRSDQAARSNARAARRSLCSIQRRLANVRCGHLERLRSSRATLPRAG